MQLTAVKFAGTGLACLALCVSACADPQPIAALQPSTCGNDGAQVAEIYGGIRGFPDLIEGKTAKEIPTNVTLMEEGTGGFFGTRDAINCWTDVGRHEQLQEFESPNLTAVRAFLLPTSNSQVDLTGNSRN